MKRGVYLHDVVISIVGRRIFHYNKVCRIQDTGCEGLTFPSFLGGFAVLVLVVRVHGSVNNGTYLHLVPWSSFVTCVTFLCCLLQLFYSSFYAFLLLFSSLADAVTCC